MATISAYTSSSISTLFSGFNSSSSNSSFGIGSLDLSTYNSIKTGAYKQLLKSYYAKNPVSSNSSSSKTDNSSATTISSQKINATKTKDASKAVVNDATDLRKTSLWQKKSVTNEDGTTENKYDADAIYKAVSAFVKDYNSMIDATADSSDTSVLRTASNMVNTTKANSKVLKELGISVDSNNKLVIDKDTFMAADMSVAKSAFAGAGSFGQSVANSAASIYSSSATTLAKLQTQNLYGSDGSYSYVSASVYNQFT